MKKIAVKNLKPNCYFKHPVYLDPNYMILTPETPLTGEMIKRLSAWRYQYVFSESSEVSNTGAAASLSTEPETGILDKSIVENKKEKEVKAFYHSMLDYIDELFTNFTTAGEINMSSLTARVKDCIARLKTDRDQLLTACLCGEKHSNYLIPHAVSTTILSLVIGEFLKFTPHRMIELGIAAMLHEIGMLKIPKQLYQNERILTPQEKKAVTTHTILGYRTLKTMSVHENIANCAYEHHERIDGSGYPRGLKGDGISLYAKIVGVTCSFNAIVSSRNFRKARDGHKAMLDLLKVRKHQYDETILKALVFCVSVFPPGTFVQLSNNSRGMVFKTNPANPKFPVVKLLVDDKGLPITPPLFVQTSEEKGLTILRVLEENEIQGFRLGEMQE